LLPTFKPTPKPAFDITFTFINVPVASQGVIQQAAARWEEVIVGDLPEQSGKAVKSLFGFGSACTYPDVIDDFHLCIGYFTGGFTDGPGGTLGLGGPDRLRSTNPRTPYTGIISLDIADALDFNTVLHEMGHGTLFDRALPFCGLTFILIAGLSGHVALGKQCVLQRQVS
jgi:hypothetical protein